MKNKILLLIIYILVSNSFALSDAKVDGFFPENLIKEGHFSDKKEFDVGNTNTATRETFFISREERRINPNKAPSNNIKIEPSVFQVRTNSYELRNPWNPRY